MDVCYIEDRRMGGSAQTKILTPFLVISIQVLKASVVTALILFTV